MFKIKTENADISKPKNRQFLNNYILERSDSTADSYCVLITRGELRNQKPAQKKNDQSARQEQKSADRSTMDGSSLLCSALLFRRHRQFRSAA